MNQDRLFSEDFYDALKDVVRVLGGNKAVGRELRPEMTATAAGDWLKDCLNPENPHRLDPEQVLFILRKGREVGCHSALYFICDECGYGRPNTIEPLDEAAELLRRGETLGRELGMIVKRLERLGTVRAAA
jgi:hypothetical protein